MNRQEFLKIASMALAGGLMSAACRTTPGNEQALDSSSDPESEENILIVGAGLAGLGAAQQLTRAGHQVQVLEGRARLGGRTWTSTAWADAPLDMGASWIHGLRGNPLTDLAMSAGVELSITNADNARLYAGNNRGLTAAEEERLEEIQGWLDEVIGEAQAGENDRSIRAVVEAALQDVPHTEKDRQFMEFLLNTSLEHEYSGSVAALSTWWFDDDETFGGQDALLATGYQKIIDYLATGVDVRLNEAVQSVDWSGPKVTLTTRQGTYTAARVLITLPLGVLKTGSVQFSPPLPDRMQGAIQALGVGVLNKCYLRFGEVFWPRGIDWLQYISPAAGQWTDWVSLEAAAGQPILLGFNAADFGTEIERWPDKDIVASAMGALRQMFGANVPEPLDYQVTRWHSDPFAQGSYSFNAVGSEPAMRDHLAESLGGRVFFAGEATHRTYFGTAHGAYLSGLRAGREIERSI